MSSANPALAMQALMVSALLNVVMTRESFCFILTPAARSWL
jgi:hypothetical protein